MNARLVAIENFHGAKWNKLRRAMFMHPTPEVRDFSSASERRMQPSEKYFQQSPWIH